MVRAMRAHGYDDAVIVGSSLMHYSFNKAGDLLGLGVNAVVRIPTDEGSRMRYAPVLLRRRRASASFSPSPSQHG